MIYYTGDIHGAVLHIRDMVMHSAAPNGSWCGDQRQLSAANGTLN